MLRLNRQEKIISFYIKINIKVFLNKLKERIVRFYGMNPEKSNDFSRIITSFHAQRLQNIINEEHGGSIVFGGRSDPKTKYVCPTIIDSPRIDSKVMNEEIFGPILPVLEFKNISDVIAFINSRPKPLALYYFGPSSNSMEKLLKETSSGAFSVNDTAFHLLNCDLPFGGVGWSGMGKYHGKIGFDSCSHLKSVFKKNTINCWPFSARYPPYTESKQRLMSLMLISLNIDQGLLFKRVFKVIVLFCLFILQKKGNLDWVGRGVRGMIQGIKNR
jgi:aldehyde dehydrogenase (NAD+)